MDTANRPKTKPRRPDSLARQAVGGRVMAGLGAFFLTGVCILCARWGYVDLLVMDAAERQAALVDRVTKTGAPPDTEQVNAIRDEFMRAQRLDARNPTIAEQLGALYALNVRGGEAGGGIGSQRAKALEQYSLATVLRPTSPYAWANLAWTRYYLGQVDAEFYRAMVNAIQLGPWEPEVQFVVVDLGFALWDEMPADLRPKVLTMAKNGQRRYAPQILAIAQKRGRLADVCAFENLAKMVACKPVSS